MRKYFLVAVAAAALAMVGAVETIAQVVAAPGTTINAGATIYDLAIAYAGLLGTIVACLASWALFKFTGIKIEANARNAIETFVNNAAGAFLVRYENLREAGKIDVNNVLIAQLANEGLSRVKGSLDVFGLDEEHLRQRIIEKIGLLTAAPVPTVVVSEIPGAVPGSPTTPVT